MWNSRAGRLSCLSRSLGHKPLTICISSLIFLLPAHQIPAQYHSKSEASIAAQKPLSSSEDGSDTTSQEPEPDSAISDAHRSFGEVIEVTARRRREDLQTIPISITAFDQHAIQERAIRDLSDLSEHTVNMDFSTSGGFGDGTSDAVVVIRGVGQVDTALFSDSGVGIYVDGVYVSRAQGGILDLLDVERVEVLRGPQGTLFGKNTNGGAIQVISRQPGPDRGGRLGVTLGRFDRLDGRLSINLPISETLNSSLALMSTHRDGWSRSLITDQDFYDDNRDVGRAALHWNPSDSFSAMLSADFTRERESGGNQILLSIENTPLIAFYNQVRSEQGFDPYTLDLWGTDSYATSLASELSFLDRDLWGTQLDLQWIFEKISIRSISAYRAFETQSFSDADGSPNLIADRAAEQRHYQFSQEAQISGGDPASNLQWVAGAIYFRERPRERNRQRILGDLFAALEAAPGPIYALPGVPNVLCFPGPPPPGLPCFGGAGNPANLAFFVGSGSEEHLELETESWAIFGESTWSLSDRLSLSLGARWTEDDKQFAYRAANGFGLESSNLFNADTWSDWSGRASLSFQAKPQLLLYSTLARGFKSGGFNGRPQQRQALDAFDPETVLSWEAGVKSDWLGRRLRVNAASFFSDYEDIHFAASVDVAGMPVFITQNAGDAEIWGIELELQAYPMQTVQLIASIGHLDSRIDRLDSRVPVNSVRLGNVLPKSPSWTYAIGAQSSHSLKNQGAIISRVDYTYREKAYPDFANTESVSQPSYGLLSLHFSYTPSSGIWDLALFGTNLTDEQYLEAGFSTGAFGIGLGLAGRPREWGLEASLRF